MKELVDYMKEQLQQLEEQKGDIAFLPSGGSICFFLDDSEPGKKMTLLGKITSNVDVLKEVKAGDVFSLYADTG